jgi:putative phosphoribosyl transferase
VEPGGCERPSAERQEPDMRFVNRRDAGRRLAYNLAQQPLTDPVVVGLPRGGMPVAVEIAHRLEAPLDIVVARRLAYPRDPTIGMGAIAEGGMRLVDDDVVSRLDITPSQLEGVVADEESELRRRTRHYRGAGSPLSVDGRTTILVDDGVASGQIARSAIEVLRRRGATHVVLAVPVGPADIVRTLREDADDVVCLHAPRSFTSIRQWYTHFPPVLDDEVASLFAAHSHDARAQST